MKSKHYTKHLAVDDPNHQGSVHHRRPACGITLEQTEKRMLFMTENLADVDCEPCRKTYHRAAAKISIGKA